VGDNGHPLQNLPQALQYLFFSQLKGRNHPRWVLSPRILKVEILPLLQGLNSAMHVASNDPKTSQTLLLQSLDSLKKWLDGLEFIACQGVLLPTIINRGTKTRINSKGRNHVRIIKPLGTLVLNRINKIIIKKEGFLPLMELDATTTQRRSTVTPRMRLQMEKRNETESLKERCQ
jgi:hypothetical protein